MHAQAYCRFAAPRVVSERKEIGLRVSTRRRDLPYRFIDPVERKPHLSRDGVRDDTNRAAFRQEHRIHIHRRVADVAREDEAGATIDGNVDDEPALGRHAPHCIEGAFNCVFRQLRRHDGTRNLFTVDFS